ncbi:MAG: hypothetical protein ABH864_00385 [archaeon]
MVILSKWVGRRTTLYAGENEYSGEVRREEGIFDKYNGGSHRQRYYFFLTDGGERITLRQTGRRRVTSPNHDGLRMAG